MSRAEAEMNGGRGAALYESDEIVKVVSFIDRFSGTDIIGRSVLFVITGILNRRLSIPDLRLSMRSDRFPIGASTHERSK
jgi:hypothetical protein